MIVKTHRQTHCLSLSLSSGWVSSDFTGCHCYTVERVFFAMKAIKTYQGNRMEDAWMNDSMMIYIEKVIHASIDDEIFLSSLVFSPGSATAYSSNINYA